MKRRKRIGALSTKDATSIATNLVLPGIAGVIVGGFLNKVPGLDKNPQYVNYAAILVGIGLAAYSGPGTAIGAAGVGMAIGGGAAVANDLLDGQPGMGLLPFGAQTYAIQGLGDTRVIVQ